MINDEPMGPDSYRMQQMRNALYFDHTVSSDKAERNMSEHGRCQMQRISLFLTVVLWLSACGGSVAPSAVAPPATIAPTANRDDDTRVLRIISTTAPQQFNPHLTSAARDFAVARLIYEPLASLDRDAQLVPILASEIPSIDAGTLDPTHRWVIWRLKAGVTWSDGAPFSADDVRFTYQFVTDEAMKSDSRPTYGDVEAVEVIDPLTVRVSFNKPVLNWNQIFTGFRGSILPAHQFAAYLASGDRDGAARATPLGTGPYRFRERRAAETLFFAQELVTTERFEFDANPRYHQPGKPWFRHIVLRTGFTADEAARLVLAPNITGSADYAWSLASSREFLTELADRGSGTLLANLGPFVERIALNLTDPAPPTGPPSSPESTTDDYVLADIRVRQAIALAIDRERILMLFPPGSQLTSNIVVYPERFRSTRAELAHDPARAAALLDEAGWQLGIDGVRRRNGIPLRLTFQVNESAVRLATQQIVIDSLRAVGIQIEASVVPPRLNYSSEIRRFAAHLEQFNWGSTGPDPIGLLADWTCAEIPREADSWAGANNFSRYCDPRFDELLQVARAETDPERRRQLIIALNDMIMDSAVVVPLVRRADPSAVSRTIVGVDLTPWDADLWNVQDWRRVTP